MYLFHNNYCTYPKCAFLVIKISGISKMLFELIELPVNDELRMS